MSYLLLPGRRALVVEQRKERRLGQSWVDLPPDGNGPTCTSLNHVLLRENAAPIDRRHAVLAIGSNAAPAQLARKFGQRGVSSVVPVVRAQASGLKVVPSAHLNQNGYVPAAPAGAPEAHRCTLFVTFLDDVQMEHMDASEPNYRRVTLDAQRHVVHLDNGERLASCYVYRSRHGVVMDPRLSSSFGSLPDQRTLLTSLVAVLPDLRDRGLTPESFLAALRDGTLDSEEVTRSMQAHLDVRDAGLDVLGTEAATYGEAGDRAAAGDDVLFVVRSRTATPGESSCAVSPDRADAVGRPSHVVVREQHHGMQVAARLLVDDDLDDECIRLDQTLRNALGVELQEPVRVAPATIPVGIRTRLGDRILGKSRYLVARVQTADLATVEQDACVLAPVALDLLGLASGDTVVLEGAPDETGAVRSMRARAFRAPDDMIGLRQQISGGELTARFPSSQEALGVFPDLPWAFLDERTRRELGVDKLFPVRVRAERGQQLRNEFRELSLIVALALFGLLTSDLPGLVKGAALLILPIVIVGVVLVRLRTRIGRRLDATDGAHRQARPAGRTSAAA